VSLSLRVFLRFVFTIVISFSLHAMLPLLANKDEYINVAEHSVIISDEAVDTNSLHSALQVVEILFKKFPATPL